jgi:hypothetical protein
LSKAPVKAFVYLFFDGVVIQFIAGFPLSRIVCSLLRIIWQNSMGSLDFFDQANDRGFGSPAYLDGFKRH